MRTMPRIRYKTARCVLYRPSRKLTTSADPFEYLLAIHSSFWAKKVQRWGLPGGRVEWREDPVQAARRELQEELEIDISEFSELGDYSYKRSMHKVICAPWDQDIDTFDKHELLDVRWFSQTQITRLSQEGLLHASYEIDAVERLAGRLAATRNASRSC